MKINVKKIFYLVILLIFLNAGCVLGYKKTDYQDDEVRFMDGTGKTKEDLVKILKEVGDYQGDTLTEEMKVSVKIVVTSISSSGSKADYKIGIKGIDNQNIIRYTPWGHLKKEDFTKKELIEYFGYEGEKNPIKGTEWDASMVLYCPDSKPDYANVEREIFVKELYTGEDIDSIEGSTTSNTEVADNTADQEEDVSWVLDFLAHPIKTSVRFVAKMICDVNDGIQLRLNEIQTGGDHTAKDEKILYSFEELQNDANGTDISIKSTDETKKGIGNRDKYTKVSEYKGDGKGDVNIDDENFTKETKIPVIIGDFYNISADKIDFFDANFLTGNTQKKDGELIHSEDSAWNKIRGPVVEIIRISIYAAGAILIILLIVFSIGIVWSGASNPRKKADYKKGLESFARAILMLVSTIVIMALCIFGSKAIYESISSDGDYELPVRVNVKDAYLFSTNITGYFRYMAQGEDLDYAYTKARFAILYGMAVKLNLLVEVFMVVRMLGIWALSVAGPLIAVNYAIRKTGLRQYNAWLLMYIILSMVQVIFCFLYKVMLNLADWL